MLKDGRSSVQYTKVSKSKRPYATLDNVDNQYCPKLKEEIETITSRVSEALPIETRSKEHQYEESWEKCPLFLQEINLRDPLPVPVDYSGVMSSEDELEKESDNESYEGGESGEESTTC